MKFIQILNEIVNHPFPSKKKVIIKNTDNNEISVDCEHAKTNEENYKEEIPAFLRRQAN